MSAGDHPGLGGASQPFPLPPVISSHIPIPSCLLHPCMQLSRWAAPSPASRHGSVPPALMFPLPTATKVVSHLIEKLPGSVGDKAPPADVIVNIIAVLNNLVVESPMAARDIVYFDGLRKLFFIKKRRDRWELCVPAHTRPPVLLSSPSLLPHSGRGSQVSFPKPWCWESLD